MKTKIKTLACMLFLVFFSLASCKKYLDEKPNKTYAVPSSLKDLQALLDENYSMNQSGAELIEIGSDDYYANSADYSSSTESDQLSYLWDSKAGTNDLFSWTSPYKAVYNANVVLDELPHINAGREEVQFNSIKGGALFYRASKFFQLAQIYAQPYSSNANMNLGIPLRLTAAIEEKSERSSVKQTYDQIISDLKVAAELLPLSSLHPTRPNKAAAYGLLARTYLSMGDYVNAGYYANQCLQLNSSLLDFNTLTPGYIPHFNAETIYYSHSNANSYILYPSYARVDSNLYNLYSTNDLRKTVYFQDNGDGTYRFVGSYDGDYWNSIVFDGIATDEMYLIRAEALARSGDKDAALNELNALLQTRWVTGTFVPYTAASASEALNIILTERRKELTHRGLRWTDVRRLNVEGANITLKRIINGTTYLLPPNDKRWAYLIPQYVIDHSELVQNPR